MGGRSTALRRVHAASALVVILVSLPLYFVNLGWPLFWADEATTALLSRHVLESGLPLTGEGNDMGSQDYDNMRGWRGLDSQVGWVQDYVGAFGLWLSGSDGRVESLAAARGVTAWGRLPFVVCGILAALFAGLVARDALGKSSSDSVGGGGARAVTGLWAAALTLSSQLGVLHARQLRYYAPATLLTVVVLHGYVRASRGKPWAHAQLGIAGVLLMLSNDLVGLCTFAALAAGHLLLRRRLSAKLLLTLAWPFATFVLWLLFTLSADRYGRLNAGGLQGLVRLIVELNAHVLPVGVIVAILLIRGCFWARGTTLRAGGSDGPAAIVLLCALLVGAITVAHSFVTFTYVRFLVPAVPIASILVAVVACSDLGWRGARSVCMAALLLAVSLTDVGAWASDMALRVTGASGYSARRHAGWVRPRTHWALAQRLADVPPHPLASVLEYLRESSPAGTTILVSYGDQTLRFYGRLTVYGGWTGYLPDAGAPPTWIWLRARSPQAEPGASGNPLAWVERNVDLASYDPLELPVIDAPWESRPDPDYFWAPQLAGPNIVLHRLTEVSR